MSSLQKGESICTKLIELFTNRVVERRNMINNYLRERAYIESVRGSVNFELLPWLEVVERRNMINNYLRGRACIESVRGS
jgi:hypothetical protein